MEEHEIRNVTGRQNEPLFAFPEGNDLMQGEWKTTIVERKRLNPS
jgi:hypothetical protein